MREKRRRPYTPLKKGDCFLRAGRFLDWREGEEQGGGSLLSVTVEVGMLLIVMGLSTFVTGGGGIVEGLCYHRLSDSGSELCSVICVAYYIK